MGIVVQLHTRIMESQNLSMPRLFVRYEKWYRYHGKRSCIALPPFYGISFGVVWSARSNFHWNGAFNRNTWAILEWNLKFHRIRNLHDARNKIINRIKFHLNASMKLMLLNEKIITLNGYIIYFNYILTIQSAVEWHARAGISWFLMRK